VYDTTVWVSVGLKRQRKRPGTEDASRQVRENYVFMELRKTLDASVENQAVGQAAAWMFLEEKKRDFSRAGVSSKPDYYLARHPPEIGERHRSFQPPTTRLLGSDVENFIETG